MPKRNEKGQFIADPIPVSKQFLDDLYTVRNMSQAAIAAKFGVSPAYIQKLLTTYGIDKRKFRGFRERPEIKFTEKQIEVLEGALLGDGHLTKATVGNSQFTYTSSDKKHVEYVAYFLKDYLTEEAKEVKRYSYFDKRTKKTYTRYFIRTCNNIAFSKLREKWYKDNIKIIPEDLKLTPLSTLLWYIGDGGIVYSIRKGKKNSCLLKLSTNCFEKKQIDSILLPQLTRFEAKTKRTEKERQYVIVVPRRKSFDFFDYIGKCPVKSLEYKWVTLPYKYSCYKEKVDHSHLESQFIQMYKTGMTYYRVAKELKVEPSLVRHYLIKNKVYRR